MRKIDIEAGCMTEYQQLADLDWSDLVDLRMEVLAENKRLLALLAGQKRDWMVSKISTPLEDRVDAEADLAETEAGLAQIEVEMARRRSDGRGFVGEGASLDKWNWSDQLLSCLTTILEQEGRHDLIKKAREMVNRGWPNV